MMNKFTLSLLTIALWSCVSTAQAADLSPQDLQTIEALQKRADKLAFGEIGSENYHLAKARTWLDLALSEYHQTDTTGLVQAATAQARGLLEALENKEANISLDTPKLLEGTEVVRQDLWDKIAAMKANANMGCGSAKIAEAEVYLVWTGHEKMESGWTHGESYARAAENLIYEAQVGITNCANAVPTVKNVEKLSLSGDATFVFGTNKLTDGAEVKLNKLAEGIKGWAQLQGVEVIGHTDRLRSDGNEAKNQELSERRAEVIRRYLAAKGVAADKIRASGVGSSRPLVQCDAKASKSQQVKCLQPNRRVEIILRGEK
jgi:outer membrane protein OmpA-like peptidoglycan-associated protein